MAFKPHYGACVQCPRKDVIIPVKSGLCQYCNHEMKQAKKKAAGKKTTTYQYKKEPTGEKHVFQAVIEELPADTPVRCFVCGDPITLLMPHNFAHVLPKKQYDRFRLNPANIRLLCFKIVADENGQGCHYDWDFKPRSELKGEGWEKMFQLEQELIEEYKKL